MKIAGDDLVAWYEKHFPDVPALSIVPARCYFCWQALDIGDTVVIRKNIAENKNVSLGDVGIVEKILSSDEGNLFIVKMGSGRSEYFIRAELKKQD